MFTVVEPISSESQQAEVLAGRPLLSLAGSCCCNIHLLCAVRQIPPPPRAFRGFLMGLGMGLGSICFGYLDNDVSQKSQLMRTLCRKS